MTDETSTVSGGQDIEIQLRWSDEDKLGHVNNARVVTLMEEARYRWSRADNDEQRLKYGTVVASLQVDYLRPLHYGPAMFVRVGVSRIGTKSYTVRHIAYQHGAVAFDGSAVMVPLAADGVSSRALDEAEREWLQRRLITQSR